MRDGGLRHRRLLGQRHMRDAVPIENLGLIVAFAFIAQRRARIGNGLPRRAALPPLSCAIRERAATLAQQRRAVKIKFLCLGWPFQARHKRAFVPVARPPGHSDGSCNLGENAPPRFAGTYAEGPPSSATEAFRDRSMTAVVIFHDT